MMICDVGILPESLHRVQQTYSHNNPKIHQMNEQVYSLIIVQFLEFERTNVKQLNPNFFLFLI